MSADADELEHGLDDIVVIIGCKCGRAIIDNASEASAMARLEDHCEHPERTPTFRTHRGPS